MNITKDGTNISQAPHDFERTIIVHAVIIGNWNSIVLRVKSKDTIATFKSQIKASQGLNCSPHHMRVFRPFDQNGQWDKGNWL